jgi:hypothetical protein
MNEDDPVYVKAMLRWMYCMDHGLEDSDDMKDIQPLILLRDLARKYDVIHLVTHLNTTIDWIVGEFKAWREDFIATIDDIFEVVGDSDSWRVLEDALVEWTCRQDNTFQHVERSALEEFLSRHPRLSGILATKLLYLRLGGPIQESP